VQRDTEVEVHIGAWTNYSVVHITSDTVLLLIVCVWESSTLWPSEIDRADCLLVYVYLMLNNEVNPGPKTKNVSFHYQDDVCGVHNLVQHQDGRK